MNKLWIKVAVPVAVLAVGLTLKFGIEISAQEVAEEEQQDNRPTVRIQELNAIEWRPQMKIVPNLLEDPEGLADDCK